jgi:hypothetical protein
VLLDLRSRDNYPIFDVETCNGHVDQSSARQDKSITTRHNRDIVGMVIIVSSDVVAGVALADHVCFFPLVFAGGLENRDE